MRALDIDDRRWPIAYAIMNGKQSDEDVDYYLRRLDDIHGRGEKFALITHIDDYSPILAHVKKLGDWSKANQEVAREWCISSAIVIPSDVIRFLFSSFFLMTTVPFPYIVTGDKEEAEEWTEGRLKRAGIPVPPRLPS